MIFSYRIQGRYILERSFLGNVRKAARLPRRPRSFEDERKMLDTFMQMLQESTKGLASGVEFKADQTEGDES